MVLIHKEDNDIRDRAELFLLLFICCEKVLQAGTQPIYLINKDQLFQLYR